MVIVIDAEKCAKIEDCPGEGLCVKVCEQGAIVEDNGEPVVVPEKCTDCELCVQTCPNLAISNEE